MDRRDFMKLTAAAGAAAVLPFGMIPKPEQESDEFRMWEPEIKIGGHYYHKGEINYVEHPCDEIHFMSDRDGIQGTAQWKAVPNNLPFLPFYLDKVDIILWSSSPYQGNSLHLIDPITGMMLSADEVHIDWYVALDDKDRVLYDAVAHVYPLFHRRRTEGLCHKDGGSKECRYLCRMDDGTHRCCKLDGKRRGIIDGQVNRFLKSPEAMWTNLPIGDNCCGHPFDVKF